MLSSLKLTLRSCLAIAEGLFSREDVEGGLAGGKFSVGGEGGGGGRPTLLMWEGGRLVVAAVAAAAAPEMLLLLLESVMALTKASGLGPSPLKLLRLQVGEMFGVAWII